MTDIELITSGEDESIDFWSYMAAHIKEAIQGELHALMLRIVSEARSNLQNNTSIVTGNLQSTIKIQSEGDLEASVGTTEFYAVYVEYGRGIVLPVKAKMLSWIDKYTGERVFAFKAGEAPPRPFLEPAVITESADFADRVVEAINVWRQTVI